MAKKKQQQCPRCGRPVLSTAKDAPCPACLMEQVMDTQSDVSGVDEAGRPMAGASRGEAPPRPEDIAPLFPQLEIAECLGRGGMGVVYKARQPRLNRWVALKILAPGRERSPAFAERLATCSASAPTLGSNSGMPCSPMVT